MSNLKHLSIPAWLALVMLSLPSLAEAEPLRLNEAVQEALRQNPNLKTASSQLKAAQAFTQSESARHDATLTLAASATRNKSPSLSQASSGVSVSATDEVETSGTLNKTLSLGTQLSAGVSASASKYSSPYVASSTQGNAEPVTLESGPGYLVSAKVGATQPLLRGAGSEVTLAPYRQAVAQQSATAGELQRTASALTRDVSLAYWELWYASQALEVDRAAEQTARAQRDDAFHRAQTGSLAFADVLTFETQLAATEETLLQSELTRATRQNELARLLGRNSSSELEVSEPEPPAAKELPTGLLNSALESSPEITTSQANLAVTRLQERTAADAYRPRLDIDTYVQSQGLGDRNVPSALSQFAGLGVLSAHIGVTLELPLSGTRYQGEARRARATLEGAQQNLEAARDQVIADMTTQLRKHDLSLRRIEIATAGLTYAKQNLAAKRALFETGSATALEITQAQDNAQAASKRLARARVDVVAADLAIDYHVGSPANNPLASR